MTVFLSASFQEKLLLNSDLEKVSQPVNKFGNWFQDSEITAEINESEKY